MSDINDLRSLAETAERAAAAGDFASAERLLREVASRQETDLGPLHPELSHTLNNLAVVCERTGKPEDAERCYRRAWAIAVASLAADHPFVSTSEQNLREFCEARGLPVDPPRPAPSARVDPKPRPAERLRISLAGPPDVDARMVASRGSSRRIVVAVAGAVGLLLLFVATRAWLGLSGPTSHTPAATDQSAAGRSERTSEPAAPVGTPAAGNRAKDARGRSVPPSGAGTTESPPPVAPVPAPVREPGRPAPRREALPQAAEKTPVTAPAPSASPVVADAQLCTALSANWHCEPASTPVRQGAIFFFTRIVSARDTTVQHRWYAGDRLRQAVDLRIRAGGTRGFRTYSRTTVYPVAGDWRVELRTKNGELLHEVRFSVR